MFRTGYLESFNCCSRIILPARDTFRLSILIPLSTDGRFESRAAGGLWLLQNKFRWINSSKPYNCFFFLVRNSIVTWRQHRVEGTHHHVNDYCSEMSSSPSNWVTCSHARCCRCFPSTYCCCAATDWTLAAMTMTINMSSY